MCRRAGIEVEATDDKARLLRDDYEILWAPMHWITANEVSPRAKILYGPHFWVFPEAPFVGAVDPALEGRAVYTTLCDWNQGVFQELCAGAPTRVPYEPIPFGIDPELEDLSRAPGKDLDCVVYLKQRPREQMDRVTAALRVHGLRYVEVIYGTYSDAAYKNLLRRSQFVIWIGSHESQGYAFQECLAAGIPILLWDVTSMFYWPKCYDHLHGVYELSATTATQWSHTCGERFVLWREFEGALARMRAKLGTYRPREFILSRVGDDVALRRLLDRLGLSI